MTGKEREAIAEITRLVDLEIENPSPRLLQGIKQSVLALRSQAPAPSDDAVERVEDLREKIARAIAQECGDGAERGEWYWVDVADAVLAVIPVAHCNHDGFCDAPAPRFTDEERRTLEEVAKYLTHLHHPEEAAVLRKMLENDALKESERG